MTGVQSDNGDESPFPQSPACANLESASASVDKTIDADLISGTQAVHRRRRAPFVVDSSDEDFHAQATKRIRADNGKAVGSHDQPGKCTSKKSNSKKSRSKKAAGKRAVTEVSPVSHLTASLANEHLDDHLSLVIEPNPSVQLRDTSEAASLFVPENEEEEFDFILANRDKIAAPGFLLRGPRDMDGLKRAREIKAEIENNLTLLQAQNKNPSTHYHVEDNPENQIIKALRQEQSMGWGDIANYLNEERRSRGEAATFTTSAVYSRFVRNAPRIAAAVGEIGFDPKDYMHLRNPTQYTQGEGTGTVSKAGKKRVKDYANATELHANIRKHVELNAVSELETVEKTEQLMQAVAKVERNFWLLVADEMERATTRLYKPNQLASRYHAI